MDPPHFPTPLDAFGVSVEAPRPPVPFLHIAEVATLITNKED